MITLNKIRIVIADDHELLREGVVNLINAHNHLEVVGEASNGLELIELTRRLLPDIIITDIFMHEMDGREATRILSKEFPLTGIIALSVVNNAFIIAEMMRCGAQGYVLKTAIKTEALKAIAAVVKGVAYYCPGAAETMARALGGHHNMHIKSADGLAFSKRQWDIIKLLCKGYSSQEIGERLFLAARTVENHRAKILMKTGCPNTASLTYYVAKNFLYLKEGEEGEVEG